MARAATTTDAFNAMAEPRRRDLLDALAEQEHSVGELMELLDLGQPHVSRHLRVLREVGLVEVRDEGRRRLYRTDPRPLAQIHQWVGRYERLWDERLEAVDAVLEDLKESERDD